MSDVDYTGCRSLGQVLDRCARLHITFGMARVGDTVRASLRRGGLLARIGDDHLYATVDAAVTALTAGPVP